MASADTVGYYGRDSTPSDPMDSKAFWDRVFSHGQDSAYSRIDVPAEEDAVLNAAIQHFGDVANKTVIDLGCGSGKAALFFAKRGARVIAIDQSDVAIENLSAFCAAQRISNLQLALVSALDVATLEPADFVFGSMILHHIEPFDAFTRALRDVLPIHGRAFFWENNASSKLLIWFRQNLVGKLWVPKCGDDEEFPLTPGEIEVLRRHFTVRVVYPELFYFRLISQYLIRGRLEGPFKFLDRVFYRWPWFRKRSYRQYVYLS